jgi:hypothetical protein
LTDQQGKILFKVIEKSSQIRSFFHPDFTVGAVVTTAQCFRRQRLLLSTLALADFTAGREFHPALKNQILYLDEQLEFADANIRIIVN